MKPWVVYDEVSGVYLGRILARDGEQMKTAAGFWPKTKKFRIEPVGGKTK